MDMGSILAGWALGVGTVVGAKALADELRFRDEMKRCDRMRDNALKTLGFDPRGMSSQEIKLRLFSK